MYYLTTVVTRYRRQCTCRQLRDVPRCDLRVERRIILRTILLTDQYLPNFIMNWHAIPPCREGTAREPCRIVSPLFRRLTRPWTINPVRECARAYRRTLPISIKNFDFDPNRFRRTPYNFRVYRATRGIISPTNRAYRVRRRISMEINEV